MNYEITDKIPHRAYVIETGITIPAKNTRRKNLSRSKYPFADLKVGQSFFIPGERKKINPYTYTVRLKPRKFTTRSATHDGVSGIRIWRIK